ETEAIDGRYLEIDMHLASGCREDLDLVRDRATGIDVLEEFLSLGGVEDPDRSGAPLQPGDAHRSHGRLVRINEGVIDPRDLECPLLVIGPVPALGTLSPTRN